MIIETLMMILDTIVSVYYIIKTIIKDGINGCEY